MQYMNNLISFIIATVLAIDINATDIVMAEKNPNFYLSNVL